MTEVESTVSSSSGRKDARYRRVRDRHYHIIAAEVMEDMAERMVAKYPTKFTFHKTAWMKFPDGTDRIEIGGFYPVNQIAGEHVVFLANFHNNDVTLSQFQVMICLLQSFIESLTVVLSYSPTGTMERIVQEGQVATAATYAHMFSTLPSCGKPTRLLVYDLHTLQNRFYLHTNAVADLCTAIPLLKQKLNTIQQSRKNDNDATAGNEQDRFCIAFPDDGAAKRFGVYFKGEYDIIVCGKTRLGDTDRRVVTIQDGPDVHGRNVVIVDDLVQTGGTLYETGRILIEAGASAVHAFVTHAVFPNEAWKRFCRKSNGDRSNCFTTFWVTNSIPTVTRTLPTDSTFEVLDLMDLIALEIDSI